MTAVPTQEQYERFTDMLPASLGPATILSTTSEPIVFVAFYAPEVHELNEATIKGCEFRLWHVGKQSKVLAGVIGEQLSTKDFVACALMDHETTVKQLKPYGDVLQELLLAAVKFHGSVK